MVHFFDGQILTAEDINQYLVNKTNSNAFNVASSRLTGLKEKVSNLHTSNLTVDNLTIPIILTPVPLGADEIGKFPELKFPYGSDCLYMGCEVPYKEFDKIVVPKGSYYTDSIDKACYQILDKPVTQYLFKDDACLVVNENKTFSVGLRVKNQNIPFKIIVLNAVQ